MPVEVDYLDTGVLNLFIFNLKEQQVILLKKLVISGNNLLTT